MSTRIGSPLGMKRLDFGGGGVRGKEILLGAGLAILVIAALVLALYGLFTPKKPETQELRFHCLKCKHEFEMMSDQLPEDYLLPKAMAEPRLDCPNPKCEAKASCIQMAKCPKCERWFLPTEGGARVCPFEDCGIDIVKYVMEQRGMK